MRAGGRPLGALKSELGVDRGHRDLPAVLLREQVLAELVHGEQAPGGGGDRTEHPRARADEDPGRHGIIVVPARLSLRKRGLNGTLAGRARAGRPWSFALIRRGVPGAPATFAVWHSCCSSRTMPRSAARSSAR